MWAQLQTSHTVDTITTRSTVIVVCVVASRVLTVVFLLSLSQSSTVELCFVDISTLWGWHIIFRRILTGVIAVIWQWTRFVQLKRQKYRL